MIPTNKPITKEKNPEIEGGIKNALSRGQNIQTIKQSFVNAGYKPRDVDKAISNISQNPANQKNLQKNQHKPLPLTKKTIKDPYKQQEQQTHQPQKLKQNSKQGVKKHHGMMKWIILGVVVVLILTIAGFLGLYWKEIIQLFT